MKSPEIFDNETIDNIESSKVQTITLSSFHKVKIDSLFKSKKSIIKKKYIKILILLILVILIFILLLFFFHKKPEEPKPEEVSSVEPKPEEVSPVEPKPEKDIPSEIEVNKTISKNDNLINETLKEKGSEEHKYYSISNSLYIKKINEKDLDNLNLLKDKKYYLTNAPYLYNISYSVDNGYKVPKNQTISIHVYWDGYLGRLPLLSIKSFLATQSSYSYELWINIPKVNDYNLAINNEEIMRLTKAFSNFHIKLWDTSTEITNTIFEPIKLKLTSSKSKPCSADEFRIISLYKYGGFYFDLDTLFLRDIGALLENDFIVTWEFQNYANSAQFFCNKNSKNIEYIAKKAIKIGSFQPWAVFNYEDTELKNISLLPSYIFDPLWVPPIDNPLKRGCNEFFEPVSENYKQKYGPLTLKNFFPNSYGFHWHNRWNYQIKENSYIEILEKEINEIIKQLITDMKN